LGEARLHVPSALAADRVELVHPRGHVMQVLASGIIPAGLVPLTAGGRGAIGARPPRASTLCALSRTTRLTLACRPRRSSSSCPSRKSALR
jgi:hypothetical protein